MLTIELVHTPPWKEIWSLLTMTLLFVVCVIVVVYRINNAARYREEHPPTLQELADASDFKFR